jgi:folate-binding protein YgfZ
VSDAAGQRAAAVRRSAGLFRLRERGLIAVEGADRVRWLNGMVSNDVAVLQPGTGRSGCYALLLTPKGGIVADLHVLQMGDAFWLELAAQALGPTLERLEKYIIADDVRLANRSEAFARLGLEGPRSEEILTRVLGGAARPAADSWTPASVAGADVVVAAFGWSGERAFQLIAPAAAGDAVHAVLEQAGDSSDLVVAGPEVLEVLRIEAGVPRFGAELDEEVLPAEAHLNERAISFDKGCFTGQEIVARIESRGQVQHLLVGLHFEGDALPEVGAAIEIDGRRTGEVTSVCRSTAHGAIGLAFVRRPHATSGSEVLVGGRAARVVALPFEGGGAPGAA